MNKQLLWLFFVLLIGYLALVFCDENVESALQSEKINEVQNNSKELFDEARTRRRHKLFSLFFGWHALAIAYWIKVKVIIVSFFVGSAVFLGLRYFWPHKCSSEISHDGPIIYDNPYSFSHHSHDRDHIPYSVDHSSHFDHSFDSSSFEPYSGYAGSYSDTAPPSIEASGPPGVHSVKRRSLDSKGAQRQQAIPMEEQMAEIMFSFLGLDSEACRRRFICEMEFRSKLNPLSSMAFRIVGRGFFNKYTNASNPNRRANSFQQCAMVNPDCVFIEENDVDEQEAQESEEASTEINNSLTSNDDSTNETNFASKKKKVVVEKENIEVQNDINISDERQHAKKRRRMHRNLSDVAERLFSQKP